MLQLRDIGLSFAGVRALDGVSLEVASGSIHAIIGPNGAGKTSLFNCISGVYTPQQGELQFGDTRLNGLPPWRITGLGIARMFQNLALFEHLTVLENLLVGRHLQYRSSWLADLFGTGGAQADEIRHRARVEEIIDFLGLARVRKTPAMILPYGLRKRVELGRALALAPRLLLLDEPAAGLNQEETEDLAGYLLDIRRELDVTLLLIEHDLRFVMDLADRITVLDFGRQIAEGDPAEVARDPKVIEAYIGGAPA